MLSRLFPKAFDNAYRGHWLAIWILAPIVLMKLAMGVNVAGLNPWVANRVIIETADGIPIGAYGAEAASVVMFLFASWGLGLLVLSSLGIVVLVRYRAMLPLMYLLLSIEQLGRKAISYVSPIIRPVATDGVSVGALINWGFSAALVIGLVLSLQGNGHSPKPRSNSA